MNQIIYSEFIGLYHSKGKNMPFTKQYVSEYIQMTETFINERLNEQSILSIPWSKSQQFNHVLTFIDMYNADTSTYLWCLPTYMYQLYINKDTKFLSETIDSVVENALILLELNDIHLGHYLYNNILGLAFIKITEDFFMKSKNNKAFLKTDIDIEHIIMKCVDNYMYRLTHGLLNNDTIMFRNIKNAKCRYKIKDGHPNIITSGPMPMNDKSIITRQLSYEYKKAELRKYWVRKLNPYQAAREYEKDTGISISRSTVRKMFIEFDAVGFPDYKLF